MVEVWIRQRNQITIPVDIAQALGLGPGSLCHMDVVNGVITLTPSHQPASPPLDSYAGCAQGAWGASPEEVEASVSADRASWDR